MKRTIFALTACVAICSCSSPDGAESREPEFFSGSFTVCEGGVAEFTDCTTRISMRLNQGGRYEELRRMYGQSNPGDTGTVRIEFYGTVTDSAERTEGVAPGAEPLTVRVDSLLAFDDKGDCLTDYLIPGLYRSRSDGRVSILRLAPLYTYLIESPDMDTVISRGRWYRTSLMTITLEDSRTGDLVPFQVVPGRESLTRTDGVRAEVYSRQWL